MPSCRYCGRAFGSWWPRNQHETVCAIRQQQGQALHAAAVACALEQARLEKNRKARERYRADTEKYRADTEKNVLRYPNGRRRSLGRQPLFWFKCRHCGGRAAPYTGNGRGNATSYYCIDCQTVYEKRSAIPSV